MRCTALIAVGFGIVLLLSACSCAAGDTMPTMMSKGNAIGYGETIEIKSHLVKGKTTIFDFYSEFCPPCRQLAPRLAKLDEKRDDLGVVKVDINRKDHRGIDWQSPVARQFNLQSIPHLKIYNEKGELVAEGEDAFSKVMQMLQAEGM